MNVLAEYWYLWILLVILAVAAFFAWSKAAQAARKRGEKRAEIEEKLKYEARLRKEYAVLTADVIARRFAGYPAGRCGVPFAATARKAGGYDGGLSGLHRAGTGDVCPLLSL